MQDGDKIPNSTFTLANGDVIKIEDIKQKLVLYFYPKANTSGCTVEAKDFSALKSEFDNLGVRIIGISKDALKALNNFITKQDLTIELATDESEKELEKFGVWVEKSMYGKKYMGIERTTFLIDENGIIKKVWAKVKVKGHADEVLNEAKKLLS